MGLEIHHLNFYLHTLKKWVLSKETCQYVEEKITTKKSTTNNILCLISHKSIILKLVTNAQ